MIETSEPGTATEILADLAAKDTIKAGDLKKRAKEIKKDHSLALDLWNSGRYHARLLAVLILDKKLVTQDLIDQLAADMLKHESTERNQLTDWFLANQLSKDKKLVALMETWQSAPSPILRRLFWYHQARRRWMGGAQPANSGELLTVLERDLVGEDPDVQWAMNYCAGQIGVHEPSYRARCVKLGESSGLYQGEPMRKNCTPSYLPEFIRIEVGKRS
jgi:3-methyladenine DNA glycosylase AlkD